jgi:hypothetical protein
MLIVLAARHAFTVDQFDQLVVHGFGQLFEMATDRHISRRLQIFNPSDFSFDV